MCPKVDARTGWCVCQDVDVMTLFRLKDDDLLPTEVHSRGEKMVIWKMVVWFTAKDNGLERHMARASGW